MQADIFEFAKDRAKGIFFHPGNHQVLVDRAEEHIAGIFCGNVCQCFGLRDGEIPQIQFDLDVVESLLFLRFNIAVLPKCKLRVRVMLVVGLIPANFRVAFCKQFNSRVGLCTQRRIFFFIEFFDFVQAQFIDNKLQPGFIAVSFVPVLVEDGDNRFAHLQHIVGRNEIQQMFCGMRERTQSTADQNAEPAHFILDHCLESDIVDGGQSASVTTAESDLELSRQVLG